MGLLVDAAWAVDLDRVRELLAQGHNINERDWRNKTPLHMAVYRGDIELIRYLVEQGANLEAKDNRGWTALRHSIYQGEFEIFDILLSSGTDVSFRYTGGDTVLHLIVLLDHGPTWINYLFDTIDVDPRTLFSVKDDDGDTPLHCLQSLASANCLVEYGFDSSTTSVVDYNRRGCAQRSCLSETNKAKHHTRRRRRRRSTETLLRGTSILLNRYHWSI